MTIEERNAERRALCAEYAVNVVRRGEIVARLAELSGEANLAAAAERIGAEFREDSLRQVMRRQVELFRRGVMA
jgi:hypothetical protein